MRHAARQLAHRFHLLSLAKLGFELHSLCLGPLAFGHVVRETQKTRFRQSHGRDRPPPRLAVLGQVGEFPMNLPNAGQFGKALQPLHPRFGCQQVGNAQGKQFGLVVARHPARLRVHAEVPSRLVGDEDPVRRVLHVAAPARFVLPQRLLGLLARRDVVEKANELPAVGQPMLDADSTSNVLPSLRLSRDSKRTSPRAMAVRKWAAESAAVSAHSRSGTCHSQYVRCAVPAHPAVGLVHLEQAALPVHQPEPVHGGLESGSVPFLTRTQRDVRSCDLIAGAPGDPGGGDDNERSRRHRDHGVPQRGVRGLERPHDCEIDPVFDDDEQHHRRQEGAQEDAAHRPGPPRFAGPAGPAGADRAGPRRGG